MGKFFGKNKKRPWLYGFFSGAFHLLWHFGTHEAVHYNDLDAPEWWWCETCREIWGDRNR